MNQAQYIIVTQVFSFVLLRWSTDVITQRLIPQYCLHRSVSQPLLHSDQHNRIPKARKLSWQHYRSPCISFHFQTNEQPTACQPEWQQALVRVYPVNKYKHQQKNNYMQQVVVIGEVNFSNFKIYFDRFQSNF